jgi:hypothetical protein
LEFVILNPSSVILSEAKDLSLFRVNSVKDLSDHDSIETPSALTGRRPVVEIEGSSMKPDKEALRAEELKLKRLRYLMDFTAALLRQADLSLDQAQALVGDAKEKALELFPDKGETFDLIYGSRFRRILVERYRLQ